MNHKDLSCLVVGENEEFVKSVSEGLNEADLAHLVAKNLQDSKEGVELILEHGDKLVVIMDGGFPTSDGGEIEDGRDQEIAHGANRLHLLAHIIDLVERITKQVHVLVISCHTNRGMGLLLVDQTDKVKQFYQLDFKGIYIGDNPNEAVAPAKLFLK